MSRVRPNNSEPFAEAPAWRGIGAGWRPLFGSYRELGFSLEWHDFTPDQVADKFPVCWADAVGQPKDIQLVQKSINEFEHGLHAAEESIARRFGTRAVRAFRLALRAIGWLIVLTFFAIALTMLVARYWLLPRANEWRQQIEGIASNALQAPVRIGRIEASWRGLNPTLALSDVALTCTDLIVGSARRLDQQCWSASMELDEGVYGTDAWQELADRLDSSRLALINAARSGAVEVIGYLIDEGADVTLAVRAGRPGPQANEIRSPLSEARRLKGTEATATLIPRGPTP